MKKPHYNFDMTDETYNYIIKRGILSRSKKEILILDLCRDGQPLKVITDITGFSIRTITNRKQSIHNKISKYFY